MNNQAKNLFERALETSIQFGNRRNPYVVILENAVIVRRNFAGDDIPVNPRNGRPFVKKGRRFTLILTEDMFNALAQEKGECSHGIWAFDPENPDLKVYTIDVNIKMESANPPVCRLYTKNNGKVDVSILNSTNLSVLDKVSDCDIERIDITVSAYDPQNDGHFTLWLRDLKMAQKEIEDNDNYWANYGKDDELPFNIDPNVDQKDTEE